MNTATGAQLAAQHFGYSVHTCEIVMLAILAVIALAALVIMWLPALSNKGMASS